MSYILDALRKSESERRQGRIPDLGSSVQMVHKPPRKSIHWSVWLTLALCINAGVVGVIFWPHQDRQASARAATRPEVGPVPLKNVAQPQSPEKPRSQASVKPRDPHTLTSSAAAGQARMITSAARPAVGHAVAVTPQRAQTAPPPLQVPQGATLIRPHRPAVPAGQGTSGGNDEAGSAPPGRVPELSDMPQTFQRQVPDLHFNGHIYSSDPGARRVMINNVYLGEGDSYKGLRIDRITQHGVVMSLNGRAFRVGVVQDWNTPN